MQVFQITEEKQQVGLTKLMLVPRWLIDVVSSLACLKIIHVLDISRKI